MNERQKRLYQYLLDNATNEYQSCTSICKALPEYYPRDEELSKGISELNSSAFRLIRMDIEDLKNDRDANKIIVTKHSKHKIATTEKEARYEINKHLKKGKYELFRANQLVAKARDDNQFTYVFELEDCEPIKVFEVSDGE